MEITMLGTGNALAAKCYNTCFVLSENNRHLLVDGGGGNTVLDQLHQANLPWNGIRDIFVTHKHIDHILGIVWMMRIICQHMNQEQYEGEAYIYGHDEVIAILYNLAHTLLPKTHNRFVGNRLHLVTVQDGEMWEIIGKKFTFFDIRSSKTKQYGFTMDFGNGEKLTCCGDEPYRECMHAYAQDSKWLLHEAFCLHSQADIYKPYEKSHSTVKDACLAAQELHVENLLLYHTVDNYMGNRKDLYLAEGRQYFQGNIYVPEDLDLLVL